MGRGDPPQSSTPFTEAWPLDAWPAVPTRVIAGRDDRFFPADFQARVARQRLGITPVVVPGGHLIALSRPVELTDALLADWEDVAQIRTADDQPGRRVDAMCGVNRRLMSYPGEVTRR